MSFYFASSAIDFGSEADVWCDAPTYRGVILYSVVTPVLCCFGLVTNAVSLTVLKRKELTGSAYTYLAVLACVDLGMSLVLMMCGVSRGLRWGPSYEALVSLPLGGSLNALGVMAVVGLTVDRAVYLWNPARCAKPLFCTPRVARRLMIAGCLVAVVSNLPYCFIFTWADDGSLSTSPFFDSKLYNAFNWFTLIAFSVLPTIVLLLGNGVLIKSLRTARKINEKCRQEKCKRRDHRSLTITLIMIIVFFLITNVPENLASRAAAVNLLFEGDRQRASAEELENLRQICIVLGAIDVNTNFIFYYAFCPAFSRALRSVCKRNHLQVNVFVLNSNGVTKPNHNQVLEISRKSIEITLNLNEIQDLECSKSHLSVPF